MTYSFGPYRLDARARRLMRGHELVALSDRHLDVLLHLVSHAQQTVSKDALMSAGWGDVAVTDNSLEQAISTLRRALGAGSADGTTYIQTLARRGYRFAVPVATSQSRHSDEALAAMLAPYRALVEGRTALESLDRHEVARALDVFDEMTRAAPDYAPGHLGLANALALANESVRAEGRPDQASLDRALHHATEACRLSPSSGEAWATLSLLCHQSRDFARASAAAERAAALEPDNWRHHLRLAYVSWGEARLRAAYRVLKLLPDFSFAHWLAATVHVARQAFDKAEQELVAGAAAQDRQPDVGPFKGVGLHLLLGLVRLARGDEAAAIEQFQRELAVDPPGHIYGREATANAWCAFGAVHARQGRDADAIAAFQCAVDALPGHPVAIAAGAALSMRSHGLVSGPLLVTRLAELREQGAMAEAAMAEAAYESLVGQTRRAAHIMSEALERTASASAGWIIPIEPLLHVDAHRDAWQPVLTLIRSRAQ